MLYQWLLGFEFQRAVFTCSGVSMSAETRNIVGHRTRLRQESKSLQHLVVPCFFDKMRRDLLGFASLSRALHRRAKGSRAFPGSGAIPWESPFGVGV